MVWLGVNWQISKSKDKGYVKLIKYTYELGENKCVETNEVFFTIVR